MKGKVRDLGEANESIASMVRRIHLFNHLWKTFQERYGKKHVLANMLVQQKSDLQNSLVHLYPSKVSLAFDKEAGKNIVSISLKQGGAKPGQDAAHIPLEQLELKFHKLIQGEKKSE